MIRAAMDPQTAKQINTPQTGAIEVIPGPEQIKLEASAALALSTLLAQNERLLIALRRANTLLSIAQVLAAKEVIEKALEDL